MSARQHPYTWAVVCGVCGYSVTGPDLGLVELGAEQHLTECQPPAPAVPAGQAVFW